MMCTRDSIPTVELKIHEWKYPSHLSWERAPGGSLRSDVKSLAWFYRGGKRHDTIAVAHLDEKEQTDRRTDGQTDERMNERGREMDGARVAGGLPALFFTVRGKGDGISLRLPDVPYYADGRLFLCCVSSCPMYYMYTYKSMYVLSDMYVCICFWGRRRTSSEWPVKEYY